MDCSTKNIQFYILNTDSFSIEVGVPNCTCVHAQVKQFLFEVTNHFVQ